MYEYLNNEEMLAYEESDNADVQQLAGAVRRLSQQLLLVRIQELGVKYLGDSAAPGLDYALWKAVVETPVRLSDEEATELDALSQQAGGWWKLQPEPEFLELEAWAIYYDQAMNPMM